MRVAVNLNLCEGSGYCAKLVPEVFRLNDGHSSVIDWVPDDGLRERLIDAEQMCPTRAITIEGATVEEPPGLRE